MPKLNQGLAQAVGEAEAVHGFGLIEPGKYVARLAEVRADTTSAGNPMWVCEFQDIRTLDGQRVPGRQWWNLNLPLDPNTPPANYEKGPEKWAQAQGLSAGRLKAFFDAFGYTSDSDTEEMIGEEAVITIGVRTIQQGARQGEKANQINDIEPLSKFGVEATEATSSYADDTPW